MIKVSWSQIKQTIDSKGLAFQFVQDDNSYTISAVDGTFEQQTVIPITNPPSLNQTDFETNYKSNGNQALRANVIQVLGKDTLVLNPWGTLFTATAGATTNQDIVLSSTVVLRGGVLFSSNASVGDYISISIVDKDNITGQGGTPDSPTVLGVYVIQWYIMPGVPNEVEDISISESLMEGLYIRIAYTSVGSTSPQVIVNFISYTGSV